MIIIEDINRFPLITSTEEPDNITLLAHYALKEVNSCVHSHMAENIILEIYTPIYIIFENNAIEMCTSDIMVLNIRGPPSKTPHSANEEVL